MRSERSQRTEAFRKNIRREELDDYFAKRRKQMMMADYEKEMNEMKDSLKTTRQQEDYITQMARQFSGDPKEEWLASIRQLRRMMPVFDGDFHHWVSKSIISKVCLTFRQEFKHLQLAAQAAKMLVDLIYISQTNNSQSFMKSLMEYEFAPHAMALATDRMFSLADRLMFVMLVVQLSRTNINHYKAIVRDGIGSVMVDLCNQLRSAPHVEISNVNLFLQALALLLQRPETAKICLFSQINSMSSMCVNYIAQVLSEETAQWSVLCAGMTALIAILKLDRPAIYRELMAIPQAVQRLVNYICFGDKVVSGKALFVVAHISYSSLEQIPSYLISQGLFQAIIKSYYEMDKRRYDIFLKGIINILTNITDSAQVSQQIAVQKELTGIVMDGVTSESLAVFKQALFCLDILFSCMHYSKLEIYLANYDIIHAFCIKLNTSIADITIHTKILTCCITLINRTKDVYHFSSDGPIIKAMQLNGMPELVENLRNNHKNKLLCQTADSFIAIFQSIHYENMVPL